MHLKDILTREQEEAGLTLYDDEDFIYLGYKEKVLAAWSSKNASEVMIRVKAQEFLDRWINLDIISESEKLRTYNG
jgi:hypothetical protein